MLINDKGWLVAGDGDPSIVAMPSPRQYSLHVPAPVGVCWHWTGGTGGPTYARNLCKAISTYRQGVDRAASWHLLIAKDGTVYQSVSLLRGTWHVGKAAQLGARLVDNVNRFLIGIELENAGRLRKLDFAWFAWPYWKAPATEPRKPDYRLQIDAKRVQHFPGDGHFDAYTTEQERTAGLLLDAIADTYKLGKASLGYCHSDFDSPRKEDPGPLWRSLVLPRLLSQRPL